MHLPRDPRWYQIAVLSGLLVYGMIALDFEVTPARAALLLGVALLTQWWCGRRTGLPAFDPKSAFISGLSLCLLLRTGSELVAVVIAFGVWWRGQRSPGLLQRP